MDFLKYLVHGYITLILILYCRYLDRLVNTLEEKKHHEVKLKEGLKDVAAKRMELQNSLSSSWPKQVSFLPRFT